MGIFDFFRKLAKTDNVKEVVIEKLAFSGIGGWIERKIKEIEIKEKDVISGIEGKIENFIKEIKVKIIILENFNVWAKRESDKIKNIVADSREKYIESVEGLIERLNDLEEPKLEKFIEKINKIFFDFNKGSFKNYERATILIGKEMASIKESIKVFSKGILKTLDQNKFIIDSFKNLFIVKEKLDTITPFDKTLEGINEKNSSLNKKISEKEEENRILKEKIEEIKKNTNYLEHLRNQKKIKSLKEESKKDILELKRLLDFKALANFFHINEEQMKMVKEHREDFQINFEKDNGKMIIDLLDEAKLNKDVISEKVNLIRAKIEETTNYEKNLKEDETQEVYNKIKEVNLEVDDLKIEKVKEEKRGEKLKISKEELINTLKQELSKMNLEVI